MSLSQDQQNALSLERVLQAEKFGRYTALQSFIKGLVEQVCAINGIAQPRVVGEFSTGTHPAFHLSAFYKGKERDVVVKLLLAECDGESYFDRECAGYKLISGSIVKHLTPRLHASGTIESTPSCPGCSYIVVSFAKGECVNQGFLGFSIEEQRQFATQVGLALKGLHETQVGDELPLALSSQRLRTVLEANADAIVQDVKCYRKGTGSWRGLSAEASLEAADFVRKNRHLLKALNDSALLHGDPHRDHFFVKRDPSGAVELSGIIDFADAVVFDPLYDFTSIHMDLLGGDLDLLKKSMEAYGLQLDLEAKKKLLLLSLVHEFDIFERMERDRCLRPMGPLSVSLSEVSWPEFRGVVFGLQHDDC